MLAIIVGPAFGVKVGAPGEAVSLPVWGAFDDEGVGHEGEPFGGFAVGGDGGGGSSVAFDDEVMLNPAAAGSASGSSA